MVAERGLIYVIFGNGLCFNSYCEVQLGEQEGAQEETAKIMLGEAEGYLVEAD